MKLSSAFLTIVISLTILLTSPFAANANSNLDLGLDKLRNGDYTAAINAFNDEIISNPYDASAYDYRGVSKAKRGDFSGSIIDYTRSLELDPQNNSALSNRGIAKARVGDLEGAINDLEMVISLDPENGQAFFNHGVAMDMSGDLNTACADWDKAGKPGDEYAIIFARKNCN